MLRATTDLSYDLGTRYYRVCWVSQRTGEQKGICAGHNEGCGRQHGHSMPPGCLHLPPYKFIVKIIRGFSSCRKKKRNRSAIYGCIILAAPQELAFCPAAARSVLWFSGLSDPSLLIKDDLTRPDTWMSSSLRALRDIQQQLLRDFHFVLADPGFRRM